MEGLNMPLVRRCLVALLVCLPALALRAEGAAPADAGSATAPAAEPTDAGTDAATEADAAAPAKPWHPGRRSRGIGLGYDGNPSLSLEYWTSDHRANVVNLSGSWSMAPADTNTISGPNLLTSVDSNNWSGTLGLGERFICASFGPADLYVYGGGYASYSNAYDDEQETKNGSVEQLILSSETLGAGVRVAAGLEYFLAKGLSLDGNIGVSGGWRRQNFFNKENSLSGSAFTTTPESSGSVDNSVISLSTLQLNVKLYF
jgi:hypothetical protein